MKKVLSIFISSIILISSIGIIANADANNLVLVNEETQYLGQGYFATVSIYENFVPILYTTAYTKSGSKVYTMAKVQHALPQITPKKLLTIVGVLKAPLQVKLPIKLSVMLHFNQKYYL